MLQELVHAVFALRQGLLGPSTQSLAEPAHRPTLAQGTVRCPHCGRLRAARGPVPRTMETLVGGVTLGRPSSCCVRCQAGFSPLDGALALLPRCTQGDLPKAAARLAVEVPADTSAELFQVLTGLTMRDHTMHEVMQDLTRDLTVLDVSPTVAEVQQKVAQVAQGKPWVPILGLAIAGADVPMRLETAMGRRPGRRHQRAKWAWWAGAWRATQGSHFFLIEEERLAHLLSWRQVQADEELAAAFQQVKAAGLMLGEAVRLWIVGDGAPWIWK